MMTLVLKERVSFVVYVTERLDEKMVLFLSFLLFFCVK